MKKAVWVIVCVISLFITTGCVTGTGTGSSTGNIAKHKNYERGEYRYEDDNLLVTVSINKEEATDDYFDFDISVDFTVENKTTVGMSFLTDYLSYNYSSGNIIKLRPGDTRVINAALSAPPLAIPPRSTIKKTFYFVTDSDGAYAALKFTISPLLENGYLVFGYNKDGKETIATITAADRTDAATLNGYEYYDPNSPVPEYGKKLGQVTVQKRVWNVLFLKSVEERRQVLFNLAMQQAIEKYGTDIALANVRYDGTWNPLSILLYFSILGFVENETITADVLGR